MILTVTLNAALDVTYRVDGLRVGGSTRVLAVAERAGGKGVNVARVLRTLGHPAEVTGLVGGATGRAIRTELARASLPEAMVTIDGESRRTVAVVDRRSGETSVLLEPGPRPTPGQWRAFTARFAELVCSARVVVLSGSLPPGLPVDAYAQLLRIVRTRELPTVLDAEGEPLLAALPERPALIKPNADELRATTGEADPMAAIERLRGAGARSVVASLGAEGLLAFTPEGGWRARPPHPVAGNPTGAGDAAVAALAAGLLAGTDWPTVLARAVALSAAAVAAPLAGSFDAALYQRLRERVDVERVDPATHDPSAPNR